MKKLLFSLLFLAQPALTAEQALTECRQIEEIAERVACYDRVVDSYLPKDASDGVQTTRPPESKPSQIAESATVPDAQSLFGTTDAEAKQIVETSLAIEQISQIEAIVADIRESATKKLTVTLDNGQIWRQLDSQSLHLKSGEAVIIRKASLGSFFMEKKSGSRSIRVKRVN
jgi:hypothetical protein